MILEQNQYIMYEDVMFLNYTTSTKATNEWCCELTCSRDTQCTAFMYEEHYKQCRLSNQTILALGTTEADTTSKVFLKNTVHTVTFTQASGECWSVMLYLLAGLAVIDNIAF